MIPTDSYHTGPPLTIPTVQFLYMGHRSTQPLSSCDHCHLLPLATRPLSSCDNCTATFSPLVAILTQAHCSHPQHFALHPHTACALSWAPLAAHMLGVRQGALSCSARHALLGSASSTYARAPAERPLMFSSTSPPRWSSMSQPRWRSPRCQHPVHPPSHRRSPRCTSTCRCTPHRDPM